MLVSARCNSSSERRLRNAAFSQHLGGGWTTLTRDYTTFLNVYAGRVALSGADERRREKAHLEALNVIRDRLFIAKEVSEMDIASKWSEAIGRAYNNRDFLALKSQYEEIAKAIQDHAGKIMGGRFWFLAR
jgi:hypothetical protein